MERGTEEISIVRTHFRINRMPIYEYQCNNCKARKEIKHSVQETPHIMCDNCGDKDMKRIITAPPAVTYKGDWFKTKKQY